MSELKFTPGPWLDYEGEELIEEGSLVITTDARQRESKVCITEILVDWSEPFETEQRANASLIAAAPELYAALEEAEKDLVAAQVNARMATKHDSKWEGVAEAIQSSIDRSRAARARARGEES